MNTAAAVAQALKEARIERVFGLPGGEVLVLIDELRKAGIDYVLMRHEADAGIAAAVYGKLRDQPGVVLVTLGPGAANLLLPISSAYLDQEPLLAISAQLADELPAAHTHQLLPLHDIFRPVTRRSEKLTRTNALFTVREALCMSMKRPYGATFVTLSAREAVAEFAPGAPPQPRADAGPPRAGDASAAARRISEALASAERPIVVVGLGTRATSAEALRAWLDAWNLPVAVTPKAKGIVDETRANFVGVVGGMAADDLMCDALRAADVRIAFGLDPVELDKTWHAELPFEWVLEAPNVCDLVPDGTELVSHEALLRELADAAAPRAWDAPFAEFQHKRTELLARNPRSSSGVMWQGDLINALAGALPGNTIVTTDVGSHKYLFGQFWPSREPATFWMSNGLSGMGYGLSAAIGAKLARPDAPVLAAVGDGGFSMNCQELETAERVGAHFITVVLEDESYSLIKLAQEGRKLEPYRMDFGPIDSVKVAEACGVRGLRTTNPDELATAVHEAVRAQQSLLVAVPIDYTGYRALF